jgi:hypothetical protein
MKALPISGTTEIQSSSLLYVSPNDTGSPLKLEAPRLHCYHLAGVSTLKLEALSCRATSASISLYLDR